MILYFIYILFITFIYYKQYINNSLYNQYSLGGLRPEAAQDCFSNTTFHHCFNNNV